MCATTHEQRLLLSLTTGASLAAPHLSAPSRGVLGGACAWRVMQLERIIPPGPSLCLRRVPLVALPSLPSPAGGA
jgi:hypothetical protein